MEAMQDGRDILSICWGYFQSGSYSTPAVGILSVQVKKKHSSFRAVYTCATKNDVYCTNMLSVDGNDLMDLYCYLHIFVRWWMEILF